MQCYCAAAGDLRTSSRVTSSDNRATSNNGKSVTEGEMGVHKIKGESGISGEVRAVSSVSHLHTFCKPVFSKRHPFDDCVVQMYLFSGSFRSTVHSASLSECWPV